MNLKSSIALPPWTKLGKKLESSCRKAIYDFKMIEDLPSIAVALSGGKDSLTLLYLLNAIRGKGLPLFTIHGIYVKNDFIDDDDTFLKDICNQIDVNLVIKKAQHLDKIDCYACSRIRRRIIFDTAKELNTNTIAFGHHKDDSIQTLLLNLLQKGEFEAILPKIKMHDFDVTIIRPLHYIYEKDIINFAKTYNFYNKKHLCPLEKTSKRVVVAKIINDMEKEFPNTRNNLSIASLIYGSKKALKK
jgi:tRNA 2-thiocytidine biosynthesis protein TtcA